MSMAETECRGRLPRQAVPQLNSGEEEASSEDVGGKGLLSRDSNTDRKGRPVTKL